MDVFLFIATATIAVVNATKNSKQPKNLSFRQHPDKNTPLLNPSLQDGTSRDAKELVCTVSEDNVPTQNGHFRSEMRLMNLWHRATYILVRQVDATNCSTPNEGTKNGQGVVLVQRRSLQKDYCPGKFDPTPGGVVGFGESCRENAIRELHEEMGIVVDDVIDDSCGQDEKRDEVERKEGTVDLKNTMKKLFTFSYSDERVNVWGDFYEVVYRGSLEDIKIQEEEVEEIIPMTLEELKQSMEDNPEDFMPDACHAMKLYFQRTLDLKVKRRLLKGYSSGDLDRYGLRPKPKVIFFDCDDTLYFDDWNTANQLTAKINDYCVNQIGLQPGKAYDLYKKYGTALKGLLVEGHIQNSPEAIDSFLEKVHDIPISELIQPDPQLRQILMEMDPNIPKYIFTASVSHHAHRCLKALGIDDLFHPTVIDVKCCNFETKHCTSSFRAAMDVAGVTDNPEECVFLDDSVKNIQAARQIGWRSVLVGRVGRDCGKPISSDHAELEIDRIHEIASVLPECFA